MRANFAVKMADDLIGLELFAKGDYHWSQVATSVWYCLNLNMIQVVKCIFEQDVQRMLLRSVSFGDRNEKIKGSLDAV